MTERLVEKVVAWGLIISVLAPEVRGAAWGMKKNQGQQGGGQMFTEAGVRE